MTIASREPLIDGHGRTIGDVRISVTDRCNFRFQYCMPAEGLPWLERSAVLSYEEMARIVGLLASMGVHDVRLTGGEPLARRDLHKLVAMVSPLVSDLSLTTNGYLLRKQLPALVAAGLTTAEVTTREVGLVSETWKSGRVPSIPVSTTATPTPLPYWPTSQALGERIEWL